MSILLQHVQCTLDRLVLESRYLGHDLHSHRVVTSSSRLLTAYNVVPEDAWGHDLRFHV